MTVLFVVLGIVAFGGGLCMHQAGAQQAPADKSPAVGEKGEKKGETPANDPPKTFTNSIGMKFVWIPPGNFMMGSPKEEKERVINEAQHKVTLSKGFYMGVYPVTQEQWQAVMGNNPSKFKGEKNLPVEQVSWEDCQEFIKKLRDKDKKLYRLPTESEWEYACRAGTKTPFYFGETISTDQANYNGDTIYGNGKKGVYRERTTTVGSFPANAWGLHDVHGNVWQWCQDWHAGDYPEKDVVDPQGPQNPPDHLRVLRGGSWYDDARYARSASRYWNVPGHRFSSIGCRLCFFVETLQKQEKEADKPKALSKIEPPGGVPLPVVEPGTNRIGVDELNRVRKRLESVPGEDLEKWVIELERIMDVKLEDGHPSPKQGCRTDFVIHMSLAFDDLKWNAKAADKLFKRACTMPTAEAKAWKEAFESLLKKEIGLKKTGQAEFEPLSGGPPWAVALVLIPVDALHEGPKYSAERGKKYLARLKQLTAEDVSLWRNKVDKFGGTDLDAAVNIILLDDFFNKDKFQRDKFKAAIEQQQEKEKAPAKESGESKEGKPMDRKDGEEKKKPTEKEQQEKKS